jgi:hypothetical protein
VRCAGGPREERFIDREVRYGLAAGALCLGLLCFVIGVETPYPIVDVGCFAVAALTVGSAVRAARSADHVQDGNRVSRGVLVAPYRWDEIESIATEASGPDVDPPQHLVIRLENGRTCHGFELDSATPTNASPGRLRRIVDRLDAMRVAAERDETS